MKRIILTEYGVFKERLLFSDKCYRKIACFVLAPWTYFGEELNISFCCTRK